MIYRICFIYLLFFSTHILAVDIDKSCLRSFNVNDSAVFNIPRSPLHNVLNPMLGISCHNFELAREQFFLNNDVFIQFDDSFDFKSEVERLKKLLEDNNNSVKRDLIYRIAAGVMVVSAVYCLTGEPVGCTAILVSGAAAFTRLTDMDKLKQLNKKITRLESQLQTLQHRWNKNNRETIDKRNQLFNDMCWIVKSNCV